MAESYTLTLQERHKMGHLKVVVADLAVDASSDLPLTLTAAEFGMTKLVAVEVMGGCLYDSSGAVGYPCHWDNANLYLQSFIEGDAAGGLAKQTSMATAATGRLIVYGK